MRRFSPEIGLSNPFFGKRSAPPIGEDSAVPLATPAPGAVFDPLTDLLRVNAKCWTEVAVASEVREYLSA